MNLRNAAHESHAIDRMVDVIIHPKEASWPFYAGLAGFTGALVIAVIFLFLDLAAERSALWTPAALGHALFHGPPMLPTTANPLASFVYIFGYTLLHGMVFVCIGGIAAQLVLQREGRWGSAATLALAAGLFAVFQATVLTFGWIFEPTLPKTLGIGWISFANLAAAISISAILGWAARRQRLDDASGAGAQTSGAA